MEKLFIPCPTCKGSGWVGNPVWEDWWQSNRHRPPHEREPLPEGEPEELPCSDCRGRGIEPTEAGRHVLEFIRRMWGETA